MLRDKGNGAQGRNRTTDTAIFSRMLYQLSYLGAAGIPGAAAVIEERRSDCPAVVQTHPKPGVAGTGCPDFRGC